MRRFQAACFLTSLQPGGERYGRITAYNLNSSDNVWQVGNGDTYE